MIEDIQSCILTLFITITVLNINTLRNEYSPKPKERTYFKLCWKIFFLTLLDIILVACWLMNIICFWRIKETWELTSKVKDFEKRKIVVV